MLTVRLYMWSLDFCASKADDLAFRNYEAGLRLTCTESRNLLHGIGLQTLKGVAAASDALMHEPSACLFGAYYTIIAHDTHCTFY